MCDDEIFGMIYNKYKHMLITKLFNDELINKQAHKEAYEDIMKDIHSSSQTYYSILNKIIDEMEKMDIEALETDDNET